MFHCYTSTNALDKAESIWQKAKDLGFVSKSIWYNLMMNLYCQSGNKENVYKLLAEMEANGIRPDQFTHSICSTASALTFDVEKLDKIVMTMKPDHQETMHWQNYVNPVKGYMRMGLTDKAMMILSKLEEQLETSRNSKDGLVFFFYMYAEAGKKDEVYRIWNLCKQRGKVVNKVYISMMRALMKFDEIEGMEKILEERESSGLLSFDFRIHTFLIEAYCADGLVEKAEALITKGMYKKVRRHREVSALCHLARAYLKKDQVPKAVEELRKAILKRPNCQKDALTACLKYLESGDSVGKGDELIQLINTKRTLSTISSDMYGFIKDKVLDSCGWIKDEDLESFPEDSGNLIKDEDLDLSVFN